MAPTTLIAVTRAVSPSLALCELTHLARVPIDVARAAQQHEEYERLLASLGASVVRAESAPELPDAVFVEDTAVVLDEVAILAHPGAPSRRAESAAVAAVLETYRPVRAIVPPGTLDGGDVLRLGRTLWVGSSSRTNTEGIEQLRDLVVPFGYRVVPVPVDGCLHLKSAVTAITEDGVLLNEAWVSPTAFGGCDIVRVDDREPDAANALRVSGTIVYPDAFPRTRDRLLERGLQVATIDCSELTKAEGAVTCCCLLFTAARAAEAHAGG